VQICVVSVSVCAKSEILDEKEVGEWKPCCKPSVKRQVRGGSETGETHKCSRIFCALFLSQNGLAVCILYRTGRKELLKSGGKSTFVFDARETSYL
jgi:hypothetical protein